jgi:hypothetical protein
MIPITISGSIAQRPGYGGHAWVFLQYLLGFKQLGYEPLFIDHHPSGSVSDSAGLRSADAGMRWLKNVMRFGGLEDSYSVLLDGGRGTVGLSREAVLDHVRASPFLLNVMGFLKDREILGAAQTRVFLDIDPGFGQMWRQLGLADVFRGHDAFVTIAENIGDRRCSIPTCGLNWIKTRQPIVLDWWPVARGGSAFTSVGTWRGPYDPVEYRGVTFGLRAHEFRRFAELPHLTGKPFEVALDIHPADGRDARLLRSNGWRMVPPASVVGDPGAYRAYIQRSKAEVMIAKGMYVQSWSGWFSDRSICYLASGKPVLAQDTGFTRNYPVGEGLLSFRSVPEAIAGVEQICGNLKHHSNAARTLAETHFDARMVLERLLERLGHDVK